MIRQEHFHPQLEKKTFVRQGVCSEIYDYMMFHARLFSGKTKNKIVFIIAFKLLC